jgi:hypothetical protein
MGAADYFTTPRNAAECGNKRTNKMATYASDTGSGKDFDPIPEGSHIAICDMFVDLGKQEATGKYAGKIEHKIYLRWQIPELRLSYEKDGVQFEGPMSIGSKYTLSLHEKSGLRKVLQSWRGKAFTPEELKKFDVTTILGVACIIAVTHAPKEGGGVYANISTVQGLPKGMPAPKLEGEVLLYDADNLGTLEKLRPWLQELINKQITETDLAKASTNDPDGWRADQQDDLDDDVPF